MSSTVRMLTDIHGSPDIDYTYLIFLVSETDAAGFIDLALFRMQESHSHFFSRRKS